MKESSILVGEPLLIVSTVWRAAKYIFCRPIAAFFSNKSNIDEQALAIGSIYQSWLTLDCT